MTAQAHAPAMRRQRRPPRRVIRNSTGAGTSRRSACAVSVSQPSPNQLKNVPAPSVCAADPSDAGYRRHATSKTFPAPPIGADGGSRGQLALAAFRPVGRPTGPWEHYDAPVPHVDVIVVGAGPAGSTAAYRLAREGARVALLDRASFPRDKPCGGGITIRGLRHLPIDVTPVVEDTITRVELGFGYRNRAPRG